MDSIIVIGFVIFFAILLPLTIRNAIKVKKRNKIMDENLEMYNKILKENMKKSDVIKAGEGTQDIKRHMDKEALRQQQQMQQQMEQQQIQQQIDDMNRMNM